MGDYMKIEYLIILALLIVIIVIIIAGQNIKKRLREQLARQKNDVENFKAQTEKEYLELQNKSKNELEDYQNEVKRNFKDRMPYGEQLLFKTFRELLSTKAFQDFTVYFHLSYEKDYSFKEVDFFVVSTKGLFVIESKSWHGVTYIYDENYQDIFNGTMFDKFASNKGVRVFNAKWSEDKNNEIVLSAYNHPLSQARGYSFDLSQILGMLISNVIVFGNSLNSSVCFNAEPLCHINVDKFTDLIIEQELEKFFTERQNCLSQTEVDNVNQKIQSCLKWQCKIDKNNYNESPFNIV